MMNPTDYRKALTDQIITALEAGTAPWIKPWDKSETMLSMPYNAISERSYHGGNCLWLQCQPFDDWQWDEQKKDEYGKTVRVKLEHPRVFYAHIFNVQQMQNIPSFVPVQGHQWQPEEAAERILRYANPKLLHDQKDKAFYSPSRDEIHLPSMELFPSSKQYYATALHELGHWTGHSSRLNRDLANQFGSQEYAREELRAELSSFFMSARIGIPHDPSQHASYINSWIQILRTDYNEIFRAAKDAEKITEYVLQFQQEKHHVTEFANSSTHQIEEELEC
jgi:antirestriction protein ArdC